MDDRGGWQLECVVDRLLSHSLCYLGKHTQTLSSFDQFSNFVLENTIERRLLHRNNRWYSYDMPLGLFLVRGDSVVVLGRVADSQSSAVERVSSLKEWEDLQDSGPTSNKHQPPSWDFDGDLIA